jgi:hypothetical protein
MDELLSLYELEIQEEKQITIRLGIKKAAGVILALGAVAGLSQGVPCSGWLIFLALVTLL